MMLPKFTSDRTSLLNSTKSSDSECILVRRRGNEYASLRCVEGLFRLYKNRNWSWDNDYDTIMSNLNLAYTYLNYLVAHHYADADPQLVKALAKSGTQYRSGLLFDADSQRSNLQDSAKIAAEIHNTRIQGLNEIASAFNQSLNTVSSAIH